MKSFTDNAGRIWTIAVNVATIKRVRAICNVDLNAIVEMDEKNNPSTKLLEQLSSDPVLLVDVLYAVCKPEADAQGISDEEFGMAMAGDAIDHAATALLDEIVNFFPEAKRRALQKILSATRRFEKIAQQKLETLIGNSQFEEELVSKLEQLTGLSTNVLESAE